MIFVTIGTQEPFDRLIQAIDEIAPLLPGKKILAQTSHSKYQPKNIECVEFLNINEFNQYFRNAELIISHAGMGSIISALMYEKPILVMPRRLDLKEHRNDHQMFTAERFEKLNYIHVAYDVESLKSLILKILNEDFKVLHKVGKYASSELIYSIKEFVTVY